LPENLGICLSLKKSVAFLEHSEHGAFGMILNFTDRARKVMQLANQEAQRFDHEYIGTEHILLGLISEGSGVAANVLTTGTTGYYFRAPVLRNFATFCDGLRHPCLPAVLDVSLVILRTLGDFRVIRQDSI
jgi:Clp amino terminal domain, pathogenicity island component